MIRSLDEKKSNKKNNSKLKSITEVTPLDQPHFLDEHLSHWFNDFMIKKDGSTPTKTKCFLYIVDKDEKSKRLKLDFLVTTQLKNGEFSRAGTYFDLAFLYRNKRPAYLNDNDWGILKMLVGILDLQDYDGKTVLLPTTDAALIILKLIIETGRCYFPDTKPHEAISDGAVLTGHIQWKIEEDGMQSIYMGISDAPLAYTIPFEPPYYLCPVNKKFGMIETTIPGNQASALIKIPALTPEQAPLIKEKLKPLLSDGQENLLPEQLDVQYQKIQPIPTLRLKTIKIHPQDRSSPWFMGPLGDPFDLAVVELTFNYGGQHVHFEDESEKITRYVDGVLLTCFRLRPQEQQYLNFLMESGQNIFLNQLDRYYALRDEYTGYMTIGALTKNFHKNFNFDDAWNTFMQEKIPLLKEKGWDIHIDNFFTYNVVEPDDEWYAEIKESQGMDWFELELGVSIHGERINLVPVLLELIKNNKDILKNIDAIASDKPFIITMQDGRQLGLSAERVKSLLSTLQHVFSLYGNKNENTRLKMQALDASLLVEIEAASHALNMRWHGGQKMLALGNKLKDFTAIQDIQVPDSFKGSLRHYQQEGLNWLQFLREYGLAGILADDMGLGKTVQILAHIMVEKTLNKSTHPFLVIAPTSLMVNWRNEAARFAPSLKVLVLHGVERKEHFASLDQYDLILTTYPLLPRDKDILLNYQYHTVILDEAQSIKNARAKFTLIANQLHCRYRLCLTGTPLENNLGELWSLFNFLLPGYLGTQKEFSSLFRTPIEKLGDIERGKLLARRIKPFVLRRTKQQVVTELPEKTEIIRIVELEGQQLDLYETIRVSMHDKIRKEIVQRGAEQSHILILDALLKLRQVCCDPALLKIALPQKTTHSAKREELLSMLVPMIAEGRKILLFSQFSSMLALIETDLARLMIPYVKLTGSTFDRETPVNVFQEGKVPLFLISLKAGGVGLNLTAADTVIHYDPWWNPAAENQATDRAYRIGQNKPVFVYKLITAGTVEEKIIEMQKRKSNLMQNLFEADSNLNTKFTIDDLQMLFEPITTVI